MILAVSMVRDEADVIDFTVRHLLAEGCDLVLVADNRSTDGTRAILDGLSASCERVCVLDDPIVAYRQSAKMTDLAASVASTGDWVVPFDADEVWFALDGRLLADALSDLDADVAIARPYVHVPHADDDLDDINPFTRITHRQPHPEPQPKVAFRWKPGAVIDMGNHGVKGVGDHHADGIIGVRHFQYRSFGQTVRKVSNGVEAYAATGYGDVLGTHWKKLAAKSFDEFGEWWDGYVAQESIVDPAPWRR